MSGRHKPKLRDLLIKLEGSEVTFLLETQEPHQGLGYLASKPKRILTARGSSITLEDHLGSSKTWAANVWDALEQCIAHHPGWWFCALGYDLKNQDEHLASNNPDPVGLPDLIAFQPSLLI